MRPGTAETMISIHRANPAQNAQGSLLLRRDRDLREHLGMPLNVCPRTANQARTWAREWCRRHGAEFFWIIRNERVIGGATIRPERESRWLGSNALKK